MSKRRAAGIEKFPFTLQSQNFALDDRISRRNRIQKYFSLIILGSHMGSNQENNRGKNCHDTVPLTWYQVKKLLFEYRIFVCPLKANSFYCKFSVIILYKCIQVYIHCGRRAGFEQLGNHHVMTLFSAKLACCLNPVIYAISHPRYREALSRYPDISSYFSRIRIPDH